MDIQKYKKIRLSYKKKFNCPILWVVHYFDNEPYELEDFYLSCIISDMIEKVLKKNSVNILNGIFGLESYKDLFEDTNFDKLSFELILKNQHYIKNKLDKIEILKLTELNDNISVENVIKFMKNSEIIKEAADKYHKPSIFLKYFYNVLKKINLLDDNWNKFNDENFTNDDLKYIFNILQSHIGKEFCIMKDNHESTILIKNILYYLFISILNNEKYIIIAKSIKKIIKLSLGDANTEILSLIDELKDHKNNLQFNLDNIDENLRILFLYFYLYLNIILENDNVDLDYLFSYRTDWGHFGYLSHQIFINNILDKIPNTNDKILIISDSTLGYQQYDEKELSLKNIYNNSHITAKCGSSYYENDALMLIPSHHKEFDTILSIIGSNDLQILIDAFKENYNDISSLSYDEIEEKVLLLKEYQDITESINIFWNNFI